MKIDFTKPLNILSKNKLSIYLFISCFAFFFMANLGYILVTKRYVFIIINILFVLCAFTCYNIAIGKKLYYTKMNIDHCQSRKNDNIKENINGKERKNNTEN